MTQCMRDFPALAYDGRPSVYHGTGSKAGRAWEDANNHIQNKKQNTGDMVTLQ